MNVDSEKDKSLQILSKTFIFSKTPKIDENDNVSTRT